MTMMIVTMITEEEDNLAKSHFNTREYLIFDTPFFCLFFLKKKINNQTLTFHLNTLQKYN